MTRNEATIAETTIIDAIIAASLEADILVIVANSLVSPGLRNIADTMPSIPEVNPESKDRINGSIARLIVQRRCSPALASLKLAFLSLALVKFAPRMSASLKLTPDRSFPLKD
ncbi:MULTISPECIES: hypothetical protein [Kamptonema]|uniref:hypothetical protein n=1 Tax=Kamptonema TaxID=1501433 RepID=UPI0001DAD57B|nr:MULTISPECIES: hypothetical protein [Kamptonema]CBN53587.1 hypothetical protein OSCI_10054 [Kamptonema sp. PCC 6506]